MNTQTLTNPAINCSFLVLSDEDFIPAQPIYADSRDYGFDFDEEELARELLAPLPASLLSQKNCEAEVDELEFCHLWFLS